MYYVYILQMSNKQLYTGFTSDLKRRLYEHRIGKNITTSKYLPAQLIFYEAFAKEADARRREKYLKSSNGKSTLRMMLREYFSE
jgi:putative endonuclease